MWQCLIWLEWAMGVAMIFAWAHGFEINNQETSVGGGDEKSIDAG